MRLIFYSLIVLNIVYFGYKFLEVGEVPQLPLSEPVEYMGAKQLILVSEQPNLTSPRVVSRPRPVAPICAAIGPFAEQSRAAQALAELQNHQYQATLKPVQIEDDISWVYLPPFANKKAASTRLAELNAQEIDSFLMTEAGPYKNSISLGYFKNVQSAQGFVKRLNANGVDAKLTTVARKKEQLWINIPVSSLEQQESDYLQQYLQQNESLREELVEC